MNNVQIRQILSRIPTHAVGVFAADQIPLVWTRPTAFIFNIQRHNKPGLHWVAIFVNKNGDAWYFDSFGVPPYIPDHINRIRRNVRKFRWNFRQLQSGTSDTCGYFCVMFLHYMSVGLGIGHLLENFSSDLRKNDQIVRNYVSKLYSGHISPLPTPLLKHPYYHRTPSISKSPPSV